MKSNPAVENLVARFVTVLSEEMQLYNELLLALRKKQTSIIAGKLDELQLAILEENQALKKTEVAGQARKETFTQINELLEQDERVRNVTQLIQQVESTYAERLSELQAGLQKIVNEVMIANDENRYLLDYSIRFVREAARELIKSSDQFPVYSSTGKSTGDKSTSNLIEGTI